MILVYSFFIKIFNQFVQKFIRNLKIPVKNEVFLEIFIYYI